MEALFVKPEFRGQGIGSKLWERVTKVKTFKQHTILNTSTVNYKVNYNSGQILNLPCENSEIRDFNVQAKNQYEL